MTVCYFGNYKPDYSRNRILISGLARNNVTVHECQTRERGWKKYWDLYNQHHQLRGHYDVMVVGFSGYSVVWFARLLTRRPIVFDAFTSLYLSDIVDRKKHSPRSLRAKFLRLVENISYRLARVVLYDTQSHIDYVVRSFGLPAEKFKRIYVGSDEEIFYPHKPQPRPSVLSPLFLIHWHGFVVPFDGVETIIRAAELIKDRSDIQFRMITSFNKHSLPLKHLAASLNITTVTFHDRVDYPTLAENINEADVCLGVFGRSPKADVVIPNKVYEAVACRKPVITADSAAVRELFTHDESIVLVPPEDPAALADAILKLIDSEGYRMRIAHHAYDIFKHQFSQPQFGRELLSILEHIQSS